MENALAAVKAFFSATAKGFTDTTAYFSGIGGFGGIYTFIVRWIFPILTVLIFVRCVLPLLRNGKTNAVWGYLDLGNSIMLPLKHWENSIGRSKLSDIVLSFPSISRRHAVLTLRDGYWTIFDLGSKSGVGVNGERIEGSRQLEIGDLITLGGAEMMLLAAEDEEEAESKRGFFTKLTSFGERIRPGKTFFLILLFQILGSIQLCQALGSELTGRIPLSFILFMLMELCYFFIMHRNGGKYIELELLAFFLCGLGLLVVASAAPSSIIKQLVAIFMGVGVFLGISFLIKDLGRARKLKYVLAAASILLLFLNLLIGETRYGAKNWIDLGFITFQPSEFVKVAFVIAGTATLDRLLTTRNLTAFIGYSGVCVGALFLMHDLGTALIFFGAFLVIAFMRSGDVRMIALICAAAALGAGLVITFKPYVAARFAVWGHVWQNVNGSGYQQARTMIAAASGGLLGVGGGNGLLVHVAASDTDLVFGTICEEWGLIVAIFAVAIIPVWACFAALSVGKCRSAFYAIAACGAAAIFVIQSMLNIFGSVDILPLTGVTLPFVSNGGSAMIGAWGLLAFIKSADERYRTDEVDETEFPDENGWDE